MDFWGVSDLCSITFLRHSCPRLQIIGPSETGPVKTDSGRKVLLYSVPEAGTRGSCSCKLLSMFSLGSHCLGDPIPWRRLLPEIRFLQLGVDRPGLCLSLVGGCHHLHWRQMFSQPLPCWGFLARCHPSVAWTTPCTISQTPWFFCPTGEKKKGSSQKGKLASHLIHQLKPQLWWQEGDGVRGRLTCPGRAWCIPAFQLLLGFVRLSRFCTPSLIRVYLVSSASESVT